MNDKKNVHEHYSVVILGGGQGGVSAAVELARKGLKTAIVEERIIGGQGYFKDYLPFMHLRKIATTVYNLQKNRIKGLNIGSMSLNFFKICEYKEAAVHEERGFYKNLLKENKIDVYEGFGEAFSDKTVTILSEDNSTNISYDHLIIATGTKSIIPQKYKDINALTLWELHSITTPPKEMIIVGETGRALEVADIFSMFGSKIHIVQEEMITLPGYDKENVEAVEESLRKRKVNIYKYASILDIYKDSIGEYHLDILQEGDIKTKHLLGTHLLYIGEDISADEGFKDLNPDFEGKILRVNDHMETSVKNVYAIGSVTGKAQEPASFQYMAKCIVENICGNHKRIEFRYMPTGLKTTPAIARIGYTDERIKKLSNDIKMVEIYQDPIRQNNGKINILLDEKYGEILSVQGIGSKANIACNVAKSVMESEGTLADLIALLQGCMSSEE